MLNADTEPYSRLDLPFADKPQLKSDELKKHKNSYIEAASKLRAISDSLSTMGPLGAATMYDKKLNLNSLEEFYKIGVDVIEVCNHIMLALPAHVVGAKPCFRPLTRVFS